MRFNIFAASVHGKKYSERGWACQDSSSVLEFDSVQAVAAADGHGGKDYFRSDTGSRLAVKVAFDRLKRFCKNLEVGQRFSDSGIKSFELALWEEWLAAVKKHWRDNPVSDAEIRWQAVSDKYKARYLSDERYIPAAYGTTLICAVSIGSQVLIVQIGDGSCVVLQQNGEFKMPVPPESENFANVTTSLCDADACNKFRHAVLDCDDNSPFAPVAIFLSTDGLDDCYPILNNAQWLYRLYADKIIDSMIKNGFALTREALRDNLLPYMTAHGSNDDISLAYMVTKDMNLLKRTIERQFLLGKENMADALRAQIADIQPKVSEQAARVREKFLPDWWAERNRNHD